MSNQSLLDPGTASCLPTADDVFGPVVSGCRQNFDFTLLFEQSILTLVPAALLLLVAPLRLLQLYKASVKTRPASVGQIKLVSCLKLNRMLLSRRKRR
jgi:ATP-binding cassette subfamily C (CFTR/MRP) protein 1